MVREGLIDPEHYYGTINCDGVNAKGEICGVTTTSGLAWKIPGRVGDSPILGAGLYVDGDVGAAGSTGRGEANLYNLCSFFIVEEMRRGAHPKDAGMAALKRVAKNTVEKRLLNDKGQPNFGLNFYIAEREGRVRGRVVHAVDVRGLHRARRADARHRGAVPGPAHSLARPSRASAIARRARPAPMRVALISHREPSLTITAKNGSRPVGILRPSAETAGPDSSVPSTKATSGRSNRTARSVTWRVRAGSPGSPAAHMAWMSARPLRTSASAATPA